MSAQGREIADRDSIRSIKVRSSRGEGTCEVCIEVHGSSTVFELKKLVCQQPGFVCSDGSCIVLVVKGEASALDVAFPSHVSIVPHASSLRHHA